MCELKNNDKMTKNKKKQQIWVKFSILSENKTKRQNCRNLVKTGWN